MCRRAVPEWAAWTWTTGTAPHWRIFPASSGRNKNISYKLKIFTSQIQPAVLHGDGVGLPHLGHQHLHGRQQGAAQEDVWRGAAGAARAGGHARRHGKNIFMFPQKIFDQTKPSQVRIVSTLPLFTAAPLVTTQAFQVRGKHLKIKIQCTPKKHVTTVIRTLQWIYTSEVPAWRAGGHAGGDGGHGGSVQGQHHRGREGAEAGRVPRQPGPGQHQVSPATRASWHVWHVTVQNWRVRVQDRGVHPLLGQQQQRQGDDSIVEDDRWYWW